MQSKKKFDPTDEQKAILTDTSRVRIVKAGPGTGKTELFVQVIKKCLSTLSLSRDQGIAAITYTNTARNEIEERLGNSLGPPHFVGTLDSFALRFIVQPFGRHVGITKKGLKLVTDDFAKGLDRFKVPVAAGKSGNYNVSTCLFNIDFVGGTIQDPDLEYGYMKVHKDFKNQVIQEKLKIWNSTGMISHSDSQYLAAKILTDSVISIHVKQILAKRFPYIFVDEIQDTGWFLSLMLTELISYLDTNAFLVGDPDQSIYEFNGADISLFDRLEKINGSKILPLQKTRRCSVSVSKVVEALSSTNASIVPLDNSKNGKVFIAAHTSLNSEWKLEIEEKIREIFPNGSVAILARNGDVVFSLKGRSKVETPECLGFIGRLLHKAEVHFLRGESARAKHIVESILCKALFEGSKVSKEILTQKGITTSVWNTSIYKILEETSRQVSGENWKLWQNRMKSFLSEEISSLGGSSDQITAVKNQMKSQAGCEQTMRGLDVVSAADSKTTHQISTVHKVKGEEYDHVVLFVPYLKPSKCISKEWWKTPFSEERRIAFVAASRAKEGFLLLLYEDSYIALKNGKKDFFNLFQDLGIIKRSSETK